MQRLLINGIAMFVKRMHNFGIVRSLHIDGVVVTCFFVLFSNAVHASDIDLKKDSIRKNDSIKVLIQTLKKLGDKSFSAGKQNDAIHYYYKYVQLNRKDAKRLNRLATLYYNTRNYEMARIFCDSVANLKLKKYPDVLFFKGVVCMNMRDYDAAIESFTKYRKVYKSRKDPNGYRKLATIYIENATFAKSDTAASQLIDIVQLDSAINTESIEFSPVYQQPNKLLYGSIFQDSAENSTKVRQLFQAVKKNGKWKSLGRMPGLVNDVQINTGNAAISADGMHMYVTRATKNWKNKIINQIYICENIDGVWTEPRALPYPVNSDVFTTTQPSIGKNLKSGAEILYFVSDRLGGKGGLDIWYTEIDTKTGLFKEPYPLDKNINSPADECSPYYDEATRTLYFSSTGHHALGGYDIFKSTGTAKKWTPAEALPAPFNTSYDEYYFTCYNGGSDGFFTSNRPGITNIGAKTCCDDLFTFKINTCTHVQCKGTIINYANYEFYDMMNDKYHMGLVYPKNNEPIAGIPLELYLAQDNDEYLISTTTTDENGNYSFMAERNKEYKLRVKNMGYFDKILPVNTHDVSCEDMNLGKTIISFMPDITLRLNIYYEYNKSSLNRQAKALIDSMQVPLFDLFPNAVIEIGSHTDNIGSDEYNMALSQKRSESVVNYLVLKGIARERLIARGYGESKPVAPNENPDGSDNPEGRSTNRRTELKIVGEVNTFYKDE